MQNLFPHIAITGATGFLGSAVSRLLSKELFLVRLLVRSEKNIPSSNRFQLFLCDVTKAETLKGALNDIDILIHLSSYVGNNKSLANLVNGEGTQNIVNEANQAGVKKIIYVSTTAVYGGDQHSGITEKQSFIDPQSVVSRSRMIAEKSLDSFKKAVILRPMFVYGNGDQWFVPAIANVIKAGLLPPERGRALLSLISVDDLANIILKILQMQKYFSGTFHVSEPPIALRDIIESVEDILGIASSSSIFDTEYTWENAMLQRLPISSHQVNLLSNDHYYDYSLLKKKTGWNPIFSFKQRINHYRYWYVKHLSI